MKEGLFFSNIFGLYIEGFLEFLVSSILVVQALLLTPPGEAISFGVAVFSLAIQVAVMPLALIWLISTKSKDELTS